MKSEKYRASSIHTGPSYKPPSLRVELAPGIAVAVRLPEGAAPHAMPELELEELDELELEELEDEELLLELEDDELEDVVLDELELLEELEEELELEELLELEEELELPLPPQDPKLVHEASLPGTVLVYQFARYRLF